MKSKKSLVFASLLLGVAGPALSQEMPGMIERTKNNLPINAGVDIANKIAGEDVVSKDAPGQSEENIPVNVEPDIPDIEGVAGRVYNEQDDPITQNALKILDQSGIIARQMKMAEAMIIMDQEMKYIDKVEQVLSAKGPFATIEVAPGVFKSFEGTPAAMRAEIEMLKLQVELDKARAEASGETVDSKAEPEEKALPTRDDGTGYQSLQAGIDDLTKAPRNLPGSSLGQLPASLTNGAPLPPSTPSTSLTPSPSSSIAEKRLEDLITEAEKRLEAREAELIKKFGSADPAVTEEPKLNLSLREVFGSPGSFSAIIEINGTKMEVRAGDTIGADIKIVRVTPELIEVDKSGKSTVFSF